jgi:hypothetical protein
MGIEIYRGSIGAAMGRWIWKRIWVGGGKYKLACGNSVDGVLVVVGVEVKPGPPAEHDIIVQILTHMKDLERERKVIQKLFETYSRERE